MSKIRYAIRGKVVATGNQIVCGAGSECVPGKKRRKRRIVAVDIFAGAGGFTTGAERAGAGVAFAINHYGPSISAHILNHPHTTHCCESVYSFDPVDMLAILQARTGSPIPDLVLASPSCKVTSRARTGGAAAKGKRGMTPEDDALRATPRAVQEFLEKIQYEVSYARKKRRNTHMPYVVVENVAEFNEWGPDRNGALFKNWLGGFEALGYHPAQDYVLQALDFGAAAERKRRFLIFTPRTRSKTPFKLDLSRVRSVLGKTIKGGLREGWAKSVKVPKRNQLGQYLIRDFGKDLAWNPSTRLRTPRLKAKWIQQLGKAMKRTGGKLPLYWTWTYTDTAPRLPQDPQRTLTTKLGSQLYVVHTKGGKHHLRGPHPEELARWFGFPPGYILPTSASEAGLLVGNAVVPAISEFVVGQLVERI